MDTLHIYLIVWGAAVFGLMSASVIYCQFTTSRVEKFEESHGLQVGLINRYAKRSAQIFWVGMFIMCMGLPVLMIWTWGVTVITAGVLIVMLAISALMYYALVVK